MAATNHSELGSDEIRSVETSDINSVVNVVSLLLYGTWNTLAGVRMFLLVEWITHTDAGRASVVEPVARLSAVELLPTVVVMLAVDEAVTHRRRR